MSKTIAQLAVTLGLPPVPTENLTPLEYAETLGEGYLSRHKHNHRKNGAHYLTPVSIARFMADYFAYSKPHIRVLDPGSGRVACSPPSAKRPPEAQPSRRCTLLHLRPTCCWRACRDWCSGFRGTGLLSVGSH